MSVGVGEQHVQEFGGGGCNMWGSNTGVVLEVRSVAERMTRRVWHEETHHMEYLLRFVGGDHGSTRMDRWEGAYE